MFDMPLWSESAMESCYKVINCVPNAKIMASGLFNHKTKMLNQNKQLNHDLLSLKISVSNDSKKYSFWINGMVYEKGVKWWQRKQQKCHQKVEREKTCFEDLTALFVLKYPNMALQNKVFLTPLWLYEKESAKIILILSF